MQKFQIEVLFKKIYKQITLFEVNRFNNLWLKLYFGDNKILWLEIFNLPQK